MTHDNPSSYTSHFVTAQDGLKLHHRDYGMAQSGPLPIVCLAGLSRNSVDFHALALALSAGTYGVPRRVLSLDYRGRGLSDYDVNWNHYDVKVESGDVLSVLTALSVDRAIFIGTSRGGLNAMVLAMMRPALMAGIVLNDVGPVLEAKGLARIRSYVGKLPAPKSWADAVDLLKHVSSNHFTALGEADWQAYARQIFKEEAGKFVAQYDPKLMKTLEKLDLEAPLPNLWPQYAGLAKIPLLVLRGANSDMLSEATVLEMQKRHKNCSAYTVEGQGHAPLLYDAETQRNIAQFIDRVDPKKPL
ncbi:MAG: alpha/beta hydrolase [Hyphomicrobiales bacterium]|nr:alpha/beta hydrolase [Hyphomicrobiales bacterium]MDE2114053.1 alpha/beta hydrolase [Hyphomicrobiales bacterium]